MVLTCLFVSQLHVSCFYDIHPYFIENFSIKLLLSFFLLLSSSSLSIFPSCGCLILFYLIPVIIIFIKYIEQLSFVLMIPLTWFRNTHIHCCKHTEVTSGNKDGAREAVWSVPFAPRVVQCRILHHITISVLNARI